MADHKDIPLATNINEKTPIDVQTPRGIIKFIPFSVKRGHGKQKWCVSIDGYCRTEPISNEQCYVFFKGAEIGSSLISVKQIDNGWQARLETIISIPEFWGEAK